jgi:hypothetical protein
MLLKMLHKSLSQKNSLGLSERQQQQIAQRFQELHQAVADMRQEFRSPDKTARTEKFSHNNRIDAGSETRRYMAKLRFRELYTQHMASIFSILTPEQRAKLKTRGMTMLMLYMLSAEFRKLAPASRTEKLTTIHPVQIDRTAEHALLLEEMLFAPTIYKHLKIPIAEFLHHQNILRI